MSTLPPLTVNDLRGEAKQFAVLESTYPEPSLYGVTDGKAIGTYLEHKFKAHLAQKYSFKPGNSASGIDFPDIDVDVKVTSFNQPQSSCPFKSARQKVFGLGYNLIVFVYEKTDDANMSSGTLNMKHTIFIEKEQTADYQTTIGLRQILQNNGNEEELIAFMHDRALPLDDIEATNIAEELILGRDQNRLLEIGYLTISNALQWRLQYGRAIAQAGIVNGVIRIA